MYMLFPNDTRALSVYFCKWVIEIPKGLDEETVFKKPNRSKREVRTEKLTGENLPRTNQL